MIVCFYLFIFFLSEDKAIFNYRLSQARHIIENTFGILAARYTEPIVIVHMSLYPVFRWRLFRRPIVAAPENVVTFTKAAIGLHNFLRTTESSVYCPPGFIDGEDGLGNAVQGGWRADEEECTGMLPISRTSSNR